MVMLTNVSKRDFTTSEGVFKAGTSKDLPEAEAEKMKAYKGEIVDIADALGPEAKKAVEGKDKEIIELKKKIAALDKEIEALKSKKR